MWKNPKLDRSADSSYEAQPLFKRFSKKISCSDCLRCECVCLSNQSGEIAWWFNFIEWQCLLFLDLLTVNSSLLSHHCNINLKQIQQSFCSTWGLLSFLWYKLLNKVFKQNFLQALKDSEYTYCSTTVCGWGYGVRVWSRGSSLMCLKCHKLLCVDPHNIITFACTLLTIWTENQQTENPNLNNIIASYFLVRECTHVQFAWYYCCITLISVYKWTQMKVTVNNEIEIWQNIHRRQTFLSIWHSSVSLISIISSFAHVKQTCQTFKKVQCMTFGPTRCGTRTSRVPSKGQSSSFITQSIIQIDSHEWFIPRAERKTNSSTTFKWAAGQF